MKATRFLLLALATFTGIGVAYLAAFRITWAQPTDPHDALRDVYVVKRQLALDAPSPRWLIVGGSSAWFGFDSTLLATATRQPVTNLGVHAELPLWFQLDEAEKLARPGDTVLLAAELVHYWRTRPTTFGATKLGELAPDTLANATWRRKAQLLGAIPPSYVLGRWLARGHSLAGPTPAELLANLRAEWARAPKPEPTGAYTYLGLDAHGDFIARRPTATHTAEDYDLTRP